jgi:hypothetical protein
VSYDTSLSARGKEGFDDLDRDVSEIRNEFYAMTVKIFG